MDLKVVVAAVIALGLAGAFILSNSTVGNLIAAAGDKMSFQEFTNISFILESSRHEIIFENQKDLSITIEGRTSGMIGDGEFDAGSVSLEGFNGRGNVSDVIILNGSVRKMQLSDASISFREKSYQSSSDFSSAVFDSMSLKELKLENITGILRQGGTEIKFSSTIIMEEVSGRFSFGRGLKIEGRAKKISIPKAGIRIE
jgi:hypothetical protein